MHIMVEDLNSIQSKFRYSLELKENLNQFDDGIFNLLCEFLQKSIYWKDVNQVFLQIEAI